MKLIILTAMMAAGLPLAAFDDPAPAALVGTWGTGSVSSVTYRNNTTGAYSDPSGTQVQYKFLPDGRYEYASLTTQSMYSCTTRLSTYKTGIVVYRGDALMFVPQSGKFTSQDNCNAKYNYEKPAVLEREAFHWRVDHDQYGVKMCLQNEKINGCAYKR